MRPSTLDKVSKKGRGQDPDTYDVLTDVCRGLQKWCAELAAHTQSG